MKNKDNKCPFCGKQTLKPFNQVGHGWQKCSNCGATHLPNPTVAKHIAPLSTWRGEDGTRHFHPEGIRD